MAEQKEKKGNGEKKRDGKKKEEGPTLFRFKLDLHCEGCAHKVKNIVKGLRGVEGAKLDVATNRLKVTGKVDPWKIKEFLEAKTKKKVEFIYPKNPPEKSKDEGKKNNATLALAAAALAAVSGMDYYPPFPNPRCSYTIVIVSDKNRKCLM